MIATHHVNVDGQWYDAGQEIPEEKREKSVQVTADEIVKAVNAPEAEPAAVEEAPKPRTASRRKSIK